MNRRRHDKLKGRLPAPEPSWQRVMELARRRIDEMTPLEKATMYEAQRFDWAYGQAKFRNPTLTRDDMQRIADQMDGIVRSDT